MNLAQLRAFAAVARCGSVTDAALDLGLTQSGVSHALASLERELALTLITRDRSGCELTEVGRNLLPHALEAIQHVDQLAERAREIAGLEAGRLRFGLIPSASATLLPRITEYRRRHPRISVAIFEGTDSEVDGWLADGTVDLGVVIGPRAESDAVLVAEDDMLAILPAGHHLSDRDRIQAADIAEEPFLMSTGGCEPIIRSVFASAQVPLRPSSRVGEMETLLAMVREGLGVTIIPRLSLGSSLGVVGVPIHPPVARRLFMVHGRAPAPAANEFLSSLRTSRATRNSPGSAPTQSRG